MPKFKDNVTGRVETFDHEPTEQEIQTRFGLPPGSASPSMGGPHPDDDGGGVAPSIGGVLGGLIGGKTPLGKVGAGIGAAAGTAYGDLYDMFTHGVGDRTAGSEAQRLATVGGLTTGAEMALPPVLRGVGKIKQMLPAGSGLGGGGALGYFLGHPGAGVAAGAALEAAPKVAAGIDALGTPLGTSAGNAARDQFLAQTPATFRGNPAIQSQATQIGDSARRSAAGPMGEVPDYLKQENWGNSLRSAGNSVKSGVNSALDGLKGLFSGGAAEAVANPPAPPSPPAFSRSPKTVGDISERLGVTGQPVSTLPTASNNPELRWSADASAAPQRTPDLTKTSPTDPTSDWTDHISRSNPRRTSPGGANYSVEIPSPPPSTSPLEGLKAASPTLPTPSIGIHDEGLQKFIEAGGRPEDWARLGGGKQAHPFGPNTVGAAQAKQWLPKTIDQAEGMSLPEQEKWESFKRANPGTTDSLLNSWYTSNQLGADPNAHLDIQGKIDKLLSLLPGSVK